MDFEPVLPKEETEAPVHTNGSAIQNARDTVIACEVCRDAVACSCSSANLTELTQCSGPELLSFFPQHLLLNLH